MKKKSTLFLLFIFLFGCEANSNLSNKSTSKEKPEYLQTDAHAALDRPYSQAVKVGNMLYLSGVIGRKPGETQLAAGGIVPETRQALENVKNTLEMNGSSMENVVKCLCMLSDISDYDEMNAEYKKFFPKDKRPARSTFAVSLPIGAKIEIECFATLK